MSINRGSYTLLHILQFLTLPTQSPDQLHGKCLRVLVLMPYNVQSLVWKHYFLSYIRLHSEEYLPYVALNIVWTTLLAVLLHFTVAVKKPWSKSMCGGKSLLSLQSTVHNGAKSGRGHGGVLFSVLFSYPPLQSTHTCPWMAMSTVGDPPSSINNQEMSYKHAYQPIS